MTPHCLCRPARVGFLATLLTALLSACGGGGSGGFAPAPTPAPPPAPTVTIALSQAKVRVGESGTVTWSATNATACTGLDSLSGTQPVSGSSEIKPTAGGQFKYTVSCTGAGGTVAQSATLIVPLPVQSTSYLNAKNLNIPSQVVPTFPLNTTSGYSEGITGGIAFGDFFQEGEISMVGFTNRWSSDPTKRDRVGEVHFYKKINGAWADKTSSILTDTTGCEAPRKLVIADFNNDGIPDIFASCHGAEFGEYSQWTGESPRIILSQPNGTYTNTPAPIKCYCHGAAAGDINGDGKIDIVTSDFNRPRDGTSGFIALIGDGKGGFTQAKDARLINEAADYDVFDKKYYKGYFTLELIDFNGDGKLDLWLFASDLQNAYILAGDNQGKFTTILQEFPKSNKEYHITDLIFKDGTLYQYVNLNVSKGSYGENLIRKFTPTMNAHEIIYRGKPEDDLIWVMPYNNKIVPYDIKNPIEVGM